MSNHNFSFDWKKIQETLSDAAKISTRELKRGVDEAKKQIGKVQLVQKRKELFAELGRNLYEAYEDGLPEELEKLLKDTELYEIIQDIQNTDKELIKLRGVDKG
ncbi:hypothetical protein [Silvanigrella sp.]|jgi:hypothetical protein|uniref:hypothetical protein n=1 Tax=Silvanigrella sp. TaxID=2024976 RepID=UPI0037C89A49|nr:hypothetical protein [Silvanigrellaceae bacterium]